MDFSILQKVPGWFERFDWHKKMRWWRVPYSQLVPIACFSYFKDPYLKLCGTWWHSSLRHCTASQRVAGSIPYGVIGIVHWHNPPGRTKTLELTQTLTEMSTMGISWGCKDGRSVRLTTLPHSCADCHEICKPQTPGTLRVFPVL